MAIGEFERGERMNNLDNLEKEVAEIQRQMSSINSMLGKVAQEISEIKKSQEEEKIQQTQPVQPVQSNAYTQPIYQKPVYTQPTYNKPVVPQPVQQPVEPQHVQPVQKPSESQAVFSQVNIPSVVNVSDAQGRDASKKGIFTESWIGSHLMGIAASILIFISLVLFAKLLIPYLSDVVKVGLMFTGSILLTGIGFYFHKKKPENSFFSALFACGEGCLYLSIIVTRAVFMYFNDIEMYVMLLLWGLMVVFIDKKKSLLFQIIADMGFLVAVFFSGNMSSYKLIFPMLGYIIVMAVVYLFVFSKKRLSRNIQIGVSLFALTVFDVNIFINFDSNTSAVIALGILTAIFTLAYVALLGMRLKFQQSENLIWGLLSACVALFSFVVTVVITPYEEPLICGFMLLIGVIGEIYMVLEDNKSHEHNLNIINAIWTGLCFLILITYAGYDLPQLINTGIIYILFLAIMCYGLFKQFDIMKIQAGGLAIWTMFYMFGSNATVMLAFCALCFFAFCFIVETFVLGEKNFMKNTAYFMMLIALAKFSYEMGLRIGQNEAELISIAAFSLVNALAIGFKFFTYGEGEENSPINIALNVLNGCMLLVVLVLMFDVSTKWMVWGYILLAVVLGCVNLGRHIRNGGGELLYAGIKFGVILLFSLLANDCENYLVSVIILAFAIVCIVGGFVLRGKGKCLRIYGLVLSMICVFKFIMVDISYENSIGHAISFLISGVLCFAISAIYNHFEKLDKIQQTGE